MWKPILAGATALAIAGSSIVYAQQRPGPGRPDGAQRWQPTVEDMRAFGEARIAALKAGLTLTPEQEKNWPAFEQAAREFAKLRVDRLHTAMEARRNPQPRSTDPAERLRRRGTAMSETGAVLKKLADATDPLYKSLDDSQKRRFMILARLEPRGMGMRGRGVGPRQDGPGRRFRGDQDGGPRGFRRTDDAPRTDTPGQERL